MGPSSDPGASWLKSTPGGIRKFLKHITTVLHPNVPDIVVSEFGFAEPFESQLKSLDDVLWDLRRAVSRPFPKIPPSYSSNASDRTIIKTSSTQSCNPFSTTT
jgi:hypothetical protein